MPVDMRRYPENWAEISRYTRLRDEWRCKFCRVPNMAVVKRNYGTPPGFIVPDFFVWCPPEKITRLAYGVRWYDDPRGTKIILTVAHLGAPLPDGTPGDPHNKMDVRECNLAALCQRCHLMYDLLDHVLNSARTRRRKRVESGQGELL